MDFTSDINYKQVQYKRLAVSRNLAVEFTGHAVSNCCKRIKSANLKLRVNAHGKAYYDALFKCHSVWDCPHCSAVIASKRNKEIGKAIENWRLEGGKVKLITYTVRHNKSHHLKELQNAVNQAYRFSKSGAPYQRIKKSFNILGSIVGNEITFSNVFGWHYHRHEIIFYKNDKDFQELENFIYKRYYKKLQELGFSILPDVGIQVSNNEGSLSDYLTKWGLENELTSSNKKTPSYTPFQFLDDPEKFELFVEYSKTMRGKRRLTWSNGMKDYFNIVEVSDDEIDEEEQNPDDEVLIIITNKEWDIILKKGLYVEVLNMAENKEIDFYSWFTSNVSSLVTFT